MMLDHWPFFGLRVTTPRLELRAPPDAELSELARLAAEGMHEPGRRPFLVSWPDLPPQERARALVQRHWRHRADWSADNWSLDLAVFADGQVVGEQDISAHDYPVLREVSTFSWVGVRYHGRGIGTEMRAAALHLAFAGLGATDAISGAFADNVSSLRVSEKLGYQADGIERLAAQGQVTITHRLRLTRGAVGGGGPGAGHDHGAGTVLADVRSTSPRKSSKSRSVPRLRTERAGTSLVQRRPLVWAVTGSGSGLAIAFGAVMLGRARCCPCCGNILGTWPRRYCCTWPPTARPAGQCPGPALSVPRGSRGGCLA